MADEDAVQIADEIELLESIYGEQLSIVEGGVRISGLGECGAAQLTVFFPTAGYPSVDPPVSLVTSALLTDAQQQRICCELAELYYVGETCAFAWASHVADAVDGLVGSSGYASGGFDIRDQDSSHAIAAALAEEEAAAAAVDAAAAAQEGERARMSELARASEAESQQLQQLKLISGAPLTDRKSTFQAHCGFVTDAADVRLMVSTLLGNNKIARAAHNIMAYRIVRSNGSVLSDCDDDGEDAAGGRLLHLLDMRGVRNACVVVTRWYGGIHLGPDRFKHINNVARLALEQAGHVQAPKS